MKSILILFITAAIALGIQWLGHLHAAIELGIFSFLPTLAVLVTLGLALGIYKLVSKTAFKWVAMVYPAFLVLLLSSGTILVVHFGEYFATQHEKEGLGYISEFTPKNKDASWYWAYDPNLKNLEFDIPTGEYKYFLSTNNLGFRSTYDFQKAKKPGEIRVMALGDSFTEGEGTTIDSTYPAFLELYLNYQLQLTGGNDGEFINVWNCGRQGSDPFYDYILYRDKLKEYKPDLVIATLNTTDLQDGVIRGGMERFMMDGTTQYNKPIVPKNEWFYRNCHICRPYIDNSTAPYPMFMGDDDASILATHYYEKYVNLFTQFNNEVIANGGKLLVVFHMTGTDEKSIHNIIRDIGLELEKRGIPILGSGYCVETTIQEEYLSIIDDKTQRQACDDNCQQQIVQQVTAQYFWPKDGHSTGRGYFLLASCIASTKANNNIEYLVLDLAKNQ